MRAEDVLLIWLLVDEKEELDMDIKSQSFVVVLPSLLLLMPRLFSEKSGPAARDE